MLLFYFFLKRHEINQLILSVFFSSSEPFSFALNARLMPENKIKNFFCLYFFFFLPSTFFSILRCVTIKNTIIVVIMYR